MLTIKRALISVSNKDGVVAFARTLRRFRVEIISTGGTLALLKKNRIPVTSVAEITGYPEILDGRVKTLHPTIHGGLLYLRSKRSHRTEIARRHIPSIDMVVVNLYPFDEVIKNPKTTFAQALENIDIGGPTMVRAAAKNFQSVAVLSHPDEYVLVADALRAHHGALPLELCEYLARRAFELTSSYDGQIAQYFNQRTHQPFPERLNMQYDKVRQLRYGENPHQRAALYCPAGMEHMTFSQLNGKELSYNNILDVESACDIIREFSDPAAAVIKHTNPCGIAEGATIEYAIEAALDSDIQSAFGGIIIANQVVEKKTAFALLKRLPFFEVLIAPGFSSEALRFLKRRQKLILIQMDMRRNVLASPTAARMLNRGMLLQECDRPVVESLSEWKKNIRVVTKRKPTVDDMHELLFAWKCAKVVKSNAIVIARHKATIGIGAGQMSRVDSMRIACEKAHGRGKDSYVASDGFFPMADSIEIAACCGVRAIIQPGGSIRDEDVITMADKHGLIMVLAGRRHFRH